VPSSFELHTRLALSGGVGDDGDCFKVLETAGIAGVFLPDSPAVAADPFVTIGIEAERQRASPLVYTVASSNFSTRHWSVLAGMSQQLASRLGERFRLAVGIGDSALKEFGLARLSYDEFDKCLESLAARLEPACRPTILVASNRRSGWRIAGARANGVIIQAGLSSSVPAAVFAELQASADEARRSDPVWHVITCVYVVPPDISEEEKQLHLNLRYRMHSLRDPHVLAAHDIPVAPTAAEGWVDYGHASLDGRVPELPAEQLAAFESLFCIPGSPGSVHAYAARLAEDGLTGICLIDLRTSATPSEAAATAVAATSLAAGAA
jgi:hypothetical protein